MPHPEQRYHAKTLWLTEPPCTAIARLTAADLGVLTGCLNAAETRAYFDHPTPLSVLSFDLDLIWAGMPNRPRIEDYAGIEHAFRRAADRPNICALLTALWVLEQGRLIEAASRTSYRLTPYLLGLYLDYVRNQEETQPAASVATTDDAE